MSEVTSFLKMLNEVYGIFGLDYTMALSTRPEGYLGETQQQITARVQAVGHYYLPVAPGAYGHH